MGGEGRGRGRGRGRLTGRQGIPCCVCDVGWLEGECLIIFEDG